MAPPSGVLVLLLGKDVECGSTRCGGDYGSTDAVATCGEGVFSVVHFGLKGCGVRGIRMGLMWTSPEGYDLGI